MKEKVVAVSGGFAPIEEGHINLFEGANKLGRVVCILNTDEFLVRKHGQAFQPLAVRKKILEHIKEIDRVVISIDEDNTVCKTLEMLKPDIFANGGDRKDEIDIPEAEVCRSLGIDMVFNVGGGKVSSSWDTVRRWNESKKESK